MRKAKQQGNGEKPLSVYIVMAGVILVNLSLVYLVNVELLPLVFDIDRELYRQFLLDVVIRTATTALGVFLGMLSFYAVFQPQKLGAGESQPDSAQKAQDDNCSAELSTPEGD